MPLGAEYVVVYSPAGYEEHWHATRYQVVPIKESKATSVQMVKQRKLEPDEIAHFEGLIARMRKA
jgi:hypothetical protein